MCGITGIAFAKESRAHFIKAMTNCLQHRGPNDSGIWLDQEAGVALGHRRLAIIDLSAAGHQPMQSANQRYMIVLNGEIYNFQELKKELSAIGVHFRGHSDTEVFLEAISHWGIETALKRSVGMFAFALWDKTESTLYLARDRFGEKPLYYGRVQGALLFGSELKALKAFDAWLPEIDRDALAAFLRYGYVPTPHSIYKGIFKLRPGVYLTVKANKETETVYWSATAEAEKGVKNPLQVGFTEAVDRVEQQLKETISLQSVADVPLGAFLSGGIDSSTIVALMQAQSSRPIKTFSIGFHEQQYNEAPFAAVIAKHLKTEHTELYVSAEDAMQVIPLLPTIYDEPFADSSQIPTYLLSKLTREHVTVSLSGDGGDELFGGYNRYRLGQRFWRQASKFPPVLRHLAGRMLQLAPGKIHRLGEFLQQGDTPAAIYKMVTSAVSQPNEWVIGGNEYLQASLPALLQKDLVDLMMASDAVTYLPDDILVKVDRAGMAVSLESRIPFLDHRLYELAWRLPQEYKLQEGQTKVILREILNRYVPQELYDRPKMGFGIPLGAWLRGLLKEWANTLLDPATLRQQGYLNEEKVSRLWQEHLSGKYNHQELMWNILMFCAWLKTL